MPIENFRRLTREDFPDAPEWADQLFDRLNRALEDLVSTLQAGVTTANENAFSLTLDVFNNVAFEYDVSELSSAPEEVRVQQSPLGVTSLVWELIDENTVRATIQFLGAPAAAQSVRIYTRGE